MRVLMSTMVLLAVLPALAEPPDRTDYTIGVEDVLSITVWGVEGLNRSVRVRPDGKITIPLVNDIRVAGLSAVQVGELLTERLAGFTPEPQVTVAVDEINSFKVYILGAGVNNQGVLAFRTPTQVLQALAHAGGVTPSASDRILIIRGAGGVNKLLEVDLGKLLSGDPTQSVWLKPGDTIVVH